MQQLAIWHEQRSVRYGFVLAGVIMAMLSELYAPKGMIFELSNTPVTSALWLLCIGIAPLPLIVGMFSGHRVTGLGPVVAGMVGCLLLIITHVLHTDRMWSLYLVAGVLGYIFAASVIKVVYGSWKQKRNKLSS